MEIPEGWHVSRLDELPSSNSRPVTKLGPFGSAIKKSDYTSEGYKVYGQQQVLSGDESFGDYWVGQEKYDQLSACAVLPGDILLSTMGTPGYVLRLSSNSLAGIINPRLMRISVCHDIANPLFLELHLKSDLAQRQFFGFRQGGTMPAINGKSVNSIKVLLPPLLEQHRIAEILGTWDRAIAVTEALIAKSEAQKKALMQQLLTGKRRLAGFEREWKEVRLDEIFQFKKGKGISKKAVVEDGLIPCVLYGELYTHYGDVVRTVKSKTNSNEGIPSVVGDVLIPASTTTTGIDLANATAVLEGGIRLGGDINILRPLDANTESRFIARLLTYAETFKLAKRAQGSTIVHLYGNHLKDIVVSVPGHAEQVAISDAIDLSEQPIQALQAKLQTLKTEKSALMQQLLTGKRRVKLTEVAA